MVQILFDFPIDFFMVLIGDNRRGQSIPVVIPSSYERQYIKICDPIKTVRMEVKDENIESIRSQAETSVLEGIETMKKRQQSDKKRELLAAPIVKIGVLAGLVSLAFAIL